MNNKIGIIAGGLMMIIVAPAALAQDFLSYEGRNSIHEGQGGERKTVDGIDLWMRGDPPRRYQVIGSLTDERHKTGIWGMISMGNMEGDLVKATKKAGGDALIMDEQHDEVIGVVGTSDVDVSGTANGGGFNAFGFGSSSAHQVKEHESRFIVIKYLPDAPAAGAVTAPNPALAPAPPSPPM